jgi:hypothetical protein
MHVEGPNVQSALELHPHCPVALQMGYAGKRHWEFKVHAAHVPLALQYGAA